MEIEDVYKNVRKTQDRTSLKQVVTSLLPNAQQQACVLMEGPCHNSKPSMALGAIEDEYYFILVCPVFIKYKELRSIFLKSIIGVYPPCLN